MVPRRAAGPSRWVPLASAAGLVALVALLYAPALDFDFVGLDDPFHVTGNPGVRAGLGAEGLRAAFRAQAGYWIPLTWLSHALDVELYGLDAGGHHATNVLLHALNAVLLFAFLRRATGDAPAALGVAALFAAHPLRVESVAWIAERKDVLSGACFWLALLAWDRYRRRASRAALAAATAAWIASLAAKPMAVTLPLLLCALDFWPYRRIASAADLRRALREKLPLFALAAGFAALTLATQARAGALGALGGLDFEVGIPQRAANALYSIARYLEASVWPRDLAPLYPHPYLPGGVPPSAAALAGSLALVAGISLAAAALRERAPALLAGWLWFLIALLPVLGLVQAGVQGRADRFTYLPHAGLLIAAVFPLARWAAARRRAAAGLALVALAATLALARATREKLPHWRDAESLYRHALRAAPASGLLRTYYGLWLAQQGRPQEALVQYEQAAGIPAFAPAAELNRAVVLESAGLAPEALAAFERAALLAPDSAPIRMALAQALLRRGRREDALPHLERARALERAERGNAAPGGIRDTRAP